jgi:hypothetical protein
MATRPLINTSIELQPTPRTPGSQTPTQAKLYPAPLFSSSSPRAHSPRKVDNSLQKTQQREEYLVEQYSTVLDALEAKYVDIGGRYMETKPETWEKKVLKDVMGSIRDAMRVNERCLEGARRDLWGAYEREEDAKKNGSEMTEQKNLENDEEVERARKGVEGIEVSTE